ncbi:hypothetical protein SBOR_8360 [Sclerotinia borealis F-4128]|uniref:Uncharacterized protein n=1 Tax=Sclerotinia borealis (strain F-4128) TaxID=1432307 RepID=W9C3B0_SCLBF|nr:hypothetical protein SBOR_8360 [Sclerotinia borealis F-4128]
MAVAAHIQPAPGSLRSILVKNSTTRLFVHPLEWTIDHLNFLNVKVVTSTSIMEPVVEEDKLGAYESIHQALKRKHLSKIIRYLETKISPCSSRDSAMREYIKTTAIIQKLHPMEAQMSFAYSRCQYATFPPIILAWHDFPFLNNHPGTPIWAYTDQTWINTARRKRYRWKPRSYATEQIKNKEELAIDPVYVAILISLAKDKKRESETPGLQETDSLQVTLFVPEHEFLPHTRGRRETKLVQYTAKISNTYLQKFEDPYKFFDASLHIEKKMLPTSKPNMVLQAIETAIHDLCGPSKPEPSRSGSSRSGSSEPLSPAPILKRKALTELKSDVGGQILDSKRRKVCSVDE